MNDILLSFFLGIVQGLTEFLPISSSAHLLLPSLIFGSNDLGLSFDIAVHAGTLVAVIYFFRKEIVLMARSILINDDSLIVHRKLAIYLIVATIPVIFAGLIFSNLIEQRIFSISSIAISNLFFAVVLLFAFLTRKSNKNLVQLTLYGALFIGIIQCFALIPGASRSGTAITAALLIGMNLKDSSKFSFLLGIPTILGALVLLIIEIQTLDIIYNPINLFIGFFVSMIFAFFTIKLFLNFVEKIGMIPFVTYRICLAVFLFLLI